LNDADILHFFWSACPSISDATHEIDRQKDVLEWLKKNLSVEPETYVYAKKYNPEVDAVDMMVEANPDAIKKGKLWLGYGKRIVLTDNSGNPLINQFITVGALPKLNTVLKQGLIADSYSAFITKAEEDTKDKDGLVIYKMPEDVEIVPGSGLIIRKTKDPNSFVSLRSMMEEYGISFVEEKDDYGNSTGKPLIGLIDGKLDNPNKSPKITIRVDGEDIETFSFLHYIAHTESNSRISYKERIKQLEDTFVRDGKLTISGKYFAVAKFSTNSDSEYTRVLILEPSGWTYLDAIRKQHEVTDNHLRKKNSDDEMKRGVLEQKAQYLSQASQMHILTAAFKDLGCINENGLAIGDGVLPYVQHVLQKIRPYTNGSIALDVDTIISDYKKENKDFDM
jgi:hypothetical protein